jgi:hypothetical protein
VNPYKTIFTILQGVQNFAGVLYNQTTNPLGVKPGCFLLGSQLAAIKQAGVQGTGTAVDFPQLILEIKSGSSQAGPRTFGMHQPSSPSMDYVVPIVCQVQLTVRHRNETQDDQVDLEGSIDRFLETSRSSIMSAAFGVSSYSWSFSKASETIAKQKHTVSKRLISVACRPYRSQLLATP